MQCLYTPTSIYNSQKNCPTARARRTDGHDGRIQTPGVRLDASVLPAELHAQGLLGHADGFGGGGHTEVSKQ